jgi:hypothetical protein
MTSQKQGKEQSEEIKQASEMDTYWTNVGIRTFK